MKYFFLFLFFNFSFSQTIKVVDDETKLPVQFAKIIFFENEKIIMGDYTDVKGEFILNLNTITSIEVSCQGYDSKKIEISKENNVVLFQKSPIILKEVRIFNKPKKEKIIENNGKKGNGSYFLISGGQDYAVFLENPYKKDCLLKSLKFNVIKIDLKTNYRLHFYKTISFDGSKDEDLLTENKTYSLEVNQTGKVEIDLSDFNVEIPSSGIYVSIENISPKIQQRFLINGEWQIKNKFALGTIYPKNMKNVFIRKTFEGANNNAWNQFGNMTSEKSTNTIKFVLKVLVSD